MPSGTAGLPQRSTFQAKGYWSDMTGRISASSGKKRVSSTVTAIGTGGNRRTLTRAPGGQPVLVG